MVSYSRYICPHFCLLLVLQHNILAPATWVLSDGQKDMNIAGRHEHCEAFCSFDGHWLRTLKLAGASEALRWAVKNPCWLMPESLLPAGFRNDFPEWWNVYFFIMPSWEAYGASSRGCNSKPIALGLQDPQKGSLQQMFQMLCNVLVFISLGIFRIAINKVRNCQDLFLGVLATVELMLAHDATDKWCAKKRYESECLAVWKNMISGPISRGVSPQGQHVPESLIGRCMKPRKKSCDHQLWLVVYPMIYRVLYPGGEPQISSINSGDAKDRVLVQKIKTEVLSLRLPQKRWMVFIWVLGSKKPQVGKFQLLKCHVISSPQKVRGLKTESGRIRHSGDWAGRPSEKPTEFRRFIWPFLGPGGSESAERLVVD